MSDGQENYLLVDSKYDLLSRAVLENPPDGQLWRVRVLDGKIEDVMAHVLVQMVGMGDDAPILLGRIIRRTGDCILVEPLQQLEEKLRQNLRVPVGFESFLYPVTGSWLGMRPIRSCDLSCGGIAFYSEQPLEIGERVEVVIPITEPPLVVCCQILRPRASSGVTPLYAAKFVALCEGEERLIREAVFNVQLFQRGKRR